MPKKRDYKRKDPNIPRGVYARGDKWGSFVCSLGVKTHLGLFKTVEEAIKAREEASKLIPVRVKTCKNCAKEFIIAQSKQEFCCDYCKGNYKYTSEKITTESQYGLISGNWQRYLSRLLYAAGRKRSELTRADLLEVLVKQNYKCAISGLPLTCKLEKGKKFWTNASVDRINAGGPYSKDNIQLVCRAVNSWRSDMPLKDFVDVCKAVASYQERLEGKDGPA